MFCERLESAADRQRFGGKTAGLAAVAVAGFRVPESVALGRDALAAFFAANGLGPAMTSALADGDYEAAFRRLRDAFATATFPPEIRLEVVAAVEALLPGAPAGLAVRSSFVDEDSADASFAGVFESYLGIASAEAALQAILDCWLSAFTPRARRYMERFGIEPRADGMAVLIQQVIDARCAGVAVTANPDSGDPWQFVVHAVAGTSEDLMSGSGAGDRYVAAWDTGLAIEASPAGEAPVLSPEHLALVVETARAIDEAFGARQDVEWAIDGAGAISVLQARPLTALPPFVPALPDQAQVRAWQRAPYVIPMRTDVPEGWVTPLYADYSMSEMWYRYQPKDILLTGLWKHEFDLHGYRYVDTETAPNFMDYLKTVEQYETWLEANEGWYRERWDHHGDELAELERIARAVLDAPPHAARLATAWLDLRGRLWDLDSFGWSGPQALGWMCEGLLTRFLAEIDPTLAVSALMGGEESWTFLRAAALQDLGRSVDSEAARDILDRTPLEAVVGRLAEAAPGFLGRYEALRWQCGKTPPSWLSRPTFWRTTWDAGDVPDLLAIRAAMRGESRDVREAAAAARRQRDAAEASYRLAVSEARGPADAARFDRMLEWARYWTQALNDRHGVGVDLLWEREVLWRLAVLLREAGVLGAEEDVLLLRAVDLRGLAERGDLAELRRTFASRLAEVRSNRRFAAPAALGELPATEPPVTAGGIAKPEGPVLHGTGFGRGHATGTARIFRELTPAVLESFTPDDVLVLLEGNAFAYADWHSLLLFVKGVVSAGRPAYHLTQVAREIGVPVIGNVAGIERIVEGQALEVDAAAGTITTV